jgi:hypothetical protein
MKNFPSDRKPAFISKAGIIFVIIFLAGCSSPSYSEIWAESKPKHHTQNGFRNYPVIPDPPPIGAAFYFRRVLDSFFLPDVPDDHYLSEKESISQFQQLNYPMSRLGNHLFVSKMQRKIMAYRPIKYG